MIKSMTKCNKESLVIFFFAFVLCAAFIDHIKVSNYYLFEVLLGLSCIVTLVHVLICRKVLLVKHYILIPFFLIIAWSAAEMLLFDGLKYAPKYFIYALIEIFIYIVLVIQFVDRENYGLFIKYTCWIFIGLAVILTGYYISQGAIVNSTDFGQSYTKYLLGFAAIGCYFLLFHERKTVYGVLSYLLLIPCMLSTNRKMWLALFVVYVAITVLYLWGPNRKSINKSDYRKLLIIVFSLVGVLVISTVVFLLFVPKVGRTVDQTFGDVKTNGDMIRRYLDIHAINMFKQSPIIGNGWGDRVYVAELDKNNMYHNSYLSVLAQLGLVGFLLYFGVFFYSLVKSFIIMFKKPQYFDYGLFILALWLYAAIVIYFRPLNRMSYYIWGPPFIFTLIFEAWEAKKHICIGKKLDSVKG